MTKVLDVHNKDYFEDGFQPFVAKRMIDVPHTEIKNRSQIVDESNTLQPSMGVKRFSIQGVEIVDGEDSPIDGLVYRPINSDTLLDNVRLYGLWSQLTNARGVAASSGTAGSYIEITFYGTGLNILLSGNTTELRASIDGGAEGSQFTPASFSTVLLNRNYSANVVIPVTHGLSLGQHTVKIRYASGAQVDLYGYEVINDTTSITINPGTAFIDGAKATLASQQSVDYTTAVTGTRGGRMVLTLKSDGTIGKYFQAAAVSQLNLTNTDHEVSNESLIRTYMFREFGNGRSDDFSMLLDSSSDRAYTLNDGSTSLVAKGVRTFGGLEGVNPGADSNFVTLTFIGTGLDVTKIDSGVGGSDTYPVDIDGINIGNLYSAGRQYLHREQIVSGLPFGTHTAKFLRQAASTWTPSFREFHVYGPKEPTYEGMKISDFYVMADFVANTGAGTDRISTGVIRKQSSRENVYTGSWTIVQSPISYTGGHLVYSNTSGNYVEVSFFGTGFDFRVQITSNASPNISMTANGTALTTGNFGSLTAATYGDGLIGYNTGTGVFDLQGGGTTDGGGLVIQGLPLAYYTIRATVNTNDFLQTDGFDAITPIYSPQDFLPGNLQNHLPIGSNSLGDAREFSPVKEKLKNWAYAHGIVSNPGTSSTTDVPLNDMSVAIKTTGKPILINFDTGVQSGTDTIQTVKVFVDGVYTGITARGNDIAGRPSAVSINHVLPVAAGVHLVQVFWATNAGNALANAADRQLTVIEL